MNPEKVCTLPTAAREAPVIEQDAISANAIVFNDANMERLIRFAEIMASGRVTVPPEMRNVGDCMAVAMQAAMWGMNAFSVMQKAHVISGKLGYEAQLVNAVINRSGVAKDRMHFEWFGPWEKVLGKFAVRKGDKGEYRVPNWTPQDEEGCGVKAWATLKGEDEPRELVLLLTQARTRNSTLWADDPRQQLAYLAQKRWCRLYAPDVLLGVYTPDELESPPAERDMGSAEVVDDAPKSTTRTNALKERLGAQKSHEPKQEPPKKTLKEVLKAIESANDADALAATAGDASHLPDADKKEARKAYSKRAEVIAAAPAQKQQTTDIDPETGEILQPQQDDFLSGLGADYGDVA